MLIRATACPRITAEFLEEAKRRLGPMQFDAEMNCEFVSTARGILDPAAIERMFGGADQLASDWAERLAVPIPGDDVVNGAEGVLL